MKGLFYLSQIGDTVEREFTKQNGEVAKIKTKELCFTDRIDSIIGEVSKNLMNKIESTNNEIRVDLQLGHMYVVEYNLYVQRYTKDGNERSFFKCAITNLSKV